MMAQDRIYARALADYSPAVVAAACDEWAKSKQFWPELASLMTLCAEHERLAEFARTPKLAAPSSAAAAELTDEQRLAIWRANDQMAVDLDGGGGFAGALASVIRNMRAKREREYPDLAARYYAETVAP